MGDGIKYVYEIEDKIPSSVVSKLEAADKASAKVDQSVKGLGDSLKGAGKSGSEAEQKIDALNKKLKELKAPGEIKRLTKEVEEFGKKEGIFKHFTHAALEPFLERAKQVAEFEFLRRGVDALIEAPAEIIERLKELGEEMLNVAAKTERTNMSFDLLFGAEQGTEVLEYLEGIAGATEFTDDRLKGAAQSLAKVGFEGESLNRALAASLDIAAFSPDKEGGFGEALASLERIKRTGHVDNRVLGGLGIGQDAFFKELSARTGEGIAELKKKIEQGKLDSEDALEALYTMIGKKTGKDLGGAGVAMGKTLEARLTHLKDLPEQFFQKLAKTDAFDRLSAAAERLLEKLNPDSPAGKKLFEGLEAGAAAVVDALDKIDVEELGNDLVELASDIKPAIEQFKEFARVIRVTAEGLGMLIGFAGKVTGLAGIYHVAKNRREYIDATNAGPDNRSFGQKVAGFFKSFEYGAGALGGNGGTMSGLPSKNVGATDLGYSTAEGLVQGMEAGMSRVEDAGAMMSKASIDGAKGPKGLDAHSPSRKYEQLGEMAGDGFIAGANRKAPEVDDVMANAFAVPAPQGGRAAPAGAPLSITIGDIIVTAGANANAQETAEATRAAVRSYLIEELENFRAEAGV